MFGRLVFASELTREQEDINNISYPLTQAPWLIYLYYHNTGQIFKNAKKISKTSKILLNLVGPQNTDYYKLYYRPDVILLVRSTWILPNIAGNKLNKNKLP